MCYEIRELNDAESCFEYQAINATLFRVALSGLDDKAEFVKNFNETVSPDFFRLGAFADGRLWAAAGFTAYTVNFDHQQLTMHGVGGVVSDFNQPNRGAVKEIFKKAFKLMKEKNILFSHLYPFEQNYYRQYGYEVSCESTVWEIPISAFKGFSGAKFVAFDDSAKMKQEIADIYKEFSEQRNMSVVRDKDFWDKFFLENRAYTSGKKIFVSYVNGVADGFMMYTMKEHEDRPSDFIVSRVYFKSFSGLRGLLSYFSTQKPYSDKVYIHLPADVDISPIIDSCSGFGKRHASAKISNDGFNQYVSFAIF